MTELQNIQAFPAPNTEAPGPKLPRLAEVPGFLEYIGQGWGTPDRTPDVVAGAADAAAAHRRRLSDCYPGRMLLVAAGRAPVRSNDTNYNFRPDSNFYWLTGAAIENAVLVMAPVPGGHDAVLYIPAPAYPGDPGFFTDADHGELWVGSAPGFTEWAQALQLDVRNLKELPSLAAKADSNAMAGPLLSGGLGPELPQLYAMGPSSELERTLSHLRIVKDPWEIDQLRQAVDHTLNGFSAVAREVPAAIKGPGERWLQGTFDRHARTYGNGAGYTTIVGSGKNAPTLHWTRCDGPVLENELLLLDMGVEMRSFYTADVTRTFPVSGTFSPAQRQVHELVEKAHRAGLAQVRPGQRFTDFHHAAMEVIAHGLDDWGLLPVSVDEALSGQGQQHRRFLVCGIGHHLGLDVHDCAQSSHEHYQGAAMEPGMVLTVEPGLYFHQHDLLVPPELRGIGVRIEDDILVTDTGSEVLSAALPLDADGIESWMQARLG